MALILCSACGHKVSSEAQSCPYCGNPVMSSVQTVEQTSKVLKAHVVIAVVVIAVGLLALFTSATFASDSGGALSPVPFILILIGLAWLAVTKILIWWRHA